MVLRAKESSDQIERETESTEEDDLACVTCGSSEIPDLLLQCASAWCTTLQHVYCVTPKEMPKGDWFCNSCKQGSAIQSKARERVEEAGAKGKRARSSRCDI
jgi:hypothetical protein